LSVLMNITVVEVHRRPHFVDDDEDHPDGDSPPIEIGAGQLNIPGNIN
uniref:VP1 n=1 Tax=Angiostrongylus cantonensis TaxID=6313 RepID=A0A0K0DRR8_ANGCA